MKPDWKDAPEWARYLAMDKNGDWFWYGMEPELGSYGWGFDGDASECRLQFAGNTDPNFRHSLEAKPTTTNPDARPGSEGQGA